MKRRVFTADEQDVHTAWRRLLCWTRRPGACRKVKTRSNRRERREGKEEARDGRDL